MILRFGAVGEPVGNLQQKLVEAGLAIDGQELVDEHFGASTEAAVRAFQARAGLEVDGYVGPKTLDALERPSSSEYIDRGWRCRPSDVRAAVRPAIIAAINDIGLREDPPGSNRGPDLLKFRTAGAPWCALAVSTWFGVCDGGSPFGRLSSTWDLRDWCEARGRLLGPSDLIEPGDVGLVLRARRRGHVALVVHVEGPTLCTIGGNESDAVRARVRQRSAFTVYGRPLQHF